MLFHFAFMLHSPSPCLLSHFSSHQSNEPQFSDQRVAADGFRARRAALPPLHFSEGSREDGWTSHPHSIKLNPRPTHCLPSPRGPFSCAAQDSTASPTLPDNKTGIVLFYWVTGLLRQHFRYICCVLTRITANWPTSTYIISIHAPVASPNCSHSFG